MPKFQDSLFTSEWERCRGPTRDSPESDTDKNISSRAQEGSANEDADGESHGEAPL